MTYRAFEITFHLSGGFSPPWRLAAGSLWQADTIFGRLCWTYYRKYDEQALHDLLHCCRDGEPPLILSNGFPTGYLPRPLMLDDTVAGNPPPLATRRRQYARRKEQQQMELLSVEEFGKAVRRKPYAGLSPVKQREVIKEYTRTRNVINRVTGTTGNFDTEESSGGGLYEFPVSYTDSITIYAKITADFIDTAKLLFADIANWGIGKSISVGLGAVSLEKDWFRETTGFATPENANGFVAMSNFIPAAGDPIDGYWRLFVKYGKFGDERSVAAPPKGSLVAQPYKNPLVMLEAGSTFRCEEIGPFYGRMVEGISDYYTDALQYALCYPVPCCVE